MTDKRLPSGMISSDDDMELLRAHHLEPDHEGLLWADDVAFVLRDLLRASEAQRDASPESVAAHPKDVERDAELLNQIVAAIDILSPTRYSPGYSIIAPNGDNVRCVDADVKDALRRWLAYRANGTASANRLKGAQVVASQQRSAATPKKPSAGAVGQEPTQEEVGRAIRCLEGSGEYYGCDDNDMTRADSMRRVLSDFLSRRSEPSEAVTTRYVDTLLNQYERACAAVVEQGDSNLSASTKERAIYRNEVRARLLADRERSQTAGRGSGDPKEGA